MQLKRVVVTGLGAISPLGNSVNELIKGIEKQESAVRYMDEWEQYNGLRSLIGSPSELKDVKSIPRKARRSMSPISIFAVQAAEQALNDSKIDRKKLATSKFGCVIGSTIGGPKCLTDVYKNMLPGGDISMITSMKLLQIFSHIATMNVSQYFGINGYIMATSAACASGLQAIGTGYELIRLGKQDAVLCGGAEELHPIVTASFDIINAASVKYNNNPKIASRPFDRDRDGVVCGEGSGIVILEEYEHAKKRNAKIYGEVVGYYTCGSSVHISDSDRESMVMCINEAMSEAQLKIDDIDYINSHATSTIQGDQSEANAIRDVFGDKVPISSLKGYIGHTLGASGALELIVSLIMMKKSVIYPTLNLENVSDECSGINHVLKPIKKKIKYFVKNSFAFGGINSALILKNIKD